MNVSRRDLLRTSALGAVSGAFQSCNRFEDLWFGSVFPEVLSPTEGVEINDGFHLLSRAAFGPWPGDLSRLSSIGNAAWIEEQLTPELVADTACDFRAERFESLYLGPGDAYAFRRPVLRAELTRHALLRAIYSRRQLFEVMVEFWSDHLNINLEKGDCVFLKPSDDRDVVRKHALGKFHELIRASATSPAMLVYLDGNANKVRREITDRPNENYARELMELHTMGVHGGYTQQDIVDAARCLSGWTFDAKRVFALNQNESYFRTEWHDDGPKKVLGVPIASGGGPADLDALVRIVCAHPSAARFISGKLCRHFVHATPPESLVARVAAEFVHTQGDMKAMLRLILNSQEFYASRGQLFKRPFKFLVSALRALAAETRAEDGILEPLHRMGHGLFQYPSPDGYPDSELPWMGTLLWRWNFALGLAANLQPGVKVNFPKLIGKLQLAQMAAPAEAWFSHCVGRSPCPEEREAFKLASRGSETAGELNPGPTNDPLHGLGLVLASPAFQRC